MCFRTRKPGPNARQRMVLFASHHKRKNELFRRMMVIGFASSFAHLSFCRFHWNKLLFHYPFTINLLLLASKPVNGKQFHYVPHHSTSAIHGRALLFIFVHAFPGSKLCTPLVHQLYYSWAKTMQTVHNWSVEWLQIRLCCVLGKWKFLF